MSEIPTEILDAIRVGDPMTLEQFRTLLANPSILADLTPGERLGAKLGYGLPLADADYEIFKDDPSLGLDVTAFAEGAFELWRRGEIGQDFFDEVLGDDPIVRGEVSMESLRAARTGWRTGEVDISALVDLPGELHLPNIGGAIFGGGESRRDEITFLLALTQLSLAQVKKATNLLAEEIPHVILTEAFDNEVISLNESIADVKAQKRADYKLEHPEDSEEQIDAHFNELDLQAEQELGTHDVDIGGGVKVRGLTAAQQLDLRYGVEDPLGIREGTTAIRDGEEKRPEWNADHVILREDGTLYADMSMEQIILMQADMVEAEFLTAGNFLPGYWDHGTRNARARLLEEANNDFDHWKVTLEKRKQATRDDVSDVPTRLVDNVFLVQDPASMAADVRNMFIENLGRLPSPTEMAELANELELDHRLDFEARLADKTALAQQQHEQDLVDAGAGGIDEAALLRRAVASADPSFYEPFGSTPTVQEAIATERSLLEPQGGLVIADEDEVQDVDPHSRLEANFFAKYGPVIDYKRERSDATEAKSNLMTSILTLDALIKQGTGF